MKYKMTKLKPEIHQVIKVKAAQAGLSISEYLEKNLSKDFQPDCTKTKKNEKAKFKFNW